MPLLKFSVGLEAGQLAIAAVLLKVLLMLRKRAIGSSGAGCRRGRCSYR